MRFVSIMTESTLNTSNSKIVPDSFLVTISGEIVTLMAAKWGDKLFLQV